MTDGFALCITKLRKERGMSQLDAAKALEISQPLLSHYERGMRECSLDLVRKFSMLYEVSADYLLGLSAQRNHTTTGGEEEERKRLEVLDYRETLLHRVITILFALLEKINSADIKQEAALSLACTLYTLLRQIVTSPELATGKNSDYPVEALLPDIYRVMFSHFSGFSSACLQALDGNFTVELRDLPKDTFAALAPAYYELIEMVEHELTVTKS